jgi:radical SAM protein with 4Fe4S-binding SPASM domain
MIQLIITRQCNFQCGHCMFSCTFSGKHMEKEVFKKALVYIGIAKSVNFLGGEPTLHPDFKGFILRTADKADNIRLVTNGSWFSDSKDIVNAIQQADFLVKEKQGHLIVRISNDLWHRAFIHNADIQTAAGILLNKGISVFSNRMEETVYPLGRAAEARFESYINRHGFGIQPAECTKGKYNVWDNISIDINGDVSPCAHHQKIIGNILKESIAEITQEAKRFIKNIRRRNPNNSFCNKCSQLFL